MGAVPMGMLTTSQQQEQNDESNTEMSSKGDGDDKEQQLTTITEEEENIIIPTMTQTKSIDEMDCTELKEFTFFFEKGWGIAVALHDGRCS